MEVGVELPAHATLPLNLPLQGQDGSTKPLRFWLGAGPGVWVLADYTCKTLCGPVISIVSDALADSGLRPGVAGAGLFWLGILLWLGLMDFVTRT